MPVKVFHENLALFDGVFAMPLDRHGPRSPFAKIGHDLARELARVGWDVPGIDVNIRATDRRGRDGQVVHYISSIAFETGEGRMHLSYFGDGGGGNALGGIRIGDGFEGESSYHSDGSCRGLEPETVGPKISAVQTVIERLKAIASFPGHDDVRDGKDAVMRRLLHVDRIPAPADMPRLYSWVGREEVALLSGMRNGEPSAPRGIHGNGWRLTPSRSGMTDLHPRATDGFSYASWDPAKKAGHHIYPVNDDMVPVEVKLDFLNDVFVYDAEAFRSARAEAHSQVSEGHRFTGADLDLWSAIAARTMIPYAEYDGSYSDPIVAIGRRLFPDECRLMRGTVEVGLDQDGSAITTLKDRDTGITMLLARTGQAGPQAFRNHLRIARDACEMTGSKPEVSDEVRNIVDSKPAPALAF